jgi:predicted dehydrogenase
MKIAIVGAGLIGKERIEAVRRIAAATNGAVVLDCVYEADPERCRQIAAKYDVATVESLSEMYKRTPDWVIICTPHDVAPRLAIEALKNGVHILVEKPLGRNIQECDEILAHRRPTQKLHVGFNYRFFAGVEAAIKDAREVRFGELISVNMILGHGNAPGMENSWKLDPVRCGGGCLIDPGIHMLDLVLQLAKELPEVCGGRHWLGFWNTGIEEEVHLLLADAAGCVFNVQISLNRWRSTFRLELNGRDGYGVVEGRGRSYGPQSYRTGRRRGWQGGLSQAASEIVEIAADKDEDSFLKETAVMLGECIAKILFPAMPSTPACDAGAGRMAMELLERCRQAIFKGVDDAQSGCLYATLL